MYMARYLTALQTKCWVPIDTNVRFTYSVYKLTVLKFTFKDSLCLSLNSAISNKIVCEYFNVGLSEIVVKTNYILWYPTPFPA